MKRLILFILLIIGVFTVSIQTGGAANQAANTGPESTNNQTKQPGEGKVIADVNITNEQITSQDDNLFEVKFTLNNKQQVQPDIFYQLCFQHQASEAVLNLECSHSFTSEEPITLRQGESKDIVIKHQAPAFLSGGYYLIIRASTKQGLPLAGGNLGLIQLHGTGNYIQILPENCYLTIEGQDGQTNIPFNNPKQVEIVDGQHRYPVNFGVDFEPLNENLILNCELKNLSSEPIEYNPVLNIRKRNIFGDLIVNKPIQEKIQILEADSTSQLNLSVFKDLDPQAYNAEMSLHNPITNEKVSNSVYLQFVVKGASATINNIQLDNDYYSQDQDINLEIIWSAAADNFPNSRHRGTKLDQVFADVAITNDQNQECLKIQNTELSTGNDQIQAKSKVDCKNPSVKLSIKDQDGSILAQKQITVPTIEKPKPISRQTPAEKKSSRLVLYLIIGAIVFLLVLLVAFFILGKSQSKVTLFLLIFFCTIGLFFLSQPFKALAQTFEMDLALDVGNGNDIEYECQTNTNGCGIGEFTAYVKHSNQTTHCGSYLGRHFPEYSTNQEALNWMKSFSADESRNGKFCSPSTPSGGHGTVWGYKWAHQGYLSWYCKDWSGYSRCWATYGSNSNPIICDVCHSISGNVEMQGDPYLNDPFSSGEPDEEPVIVAVNNATSNSCDNGIYSLRLEATFDGETKEYQITSKKGGFTNRGGSISFEPKDNCGQHTLNYTVTGCYEADGSYYEADGISCDSVSGSLNFQIDCITSSPSPTPPTNCFIRCGPADGDKPLNSFPTLTQACSFEEGGGYIDSQGHLKKDGCVSRIKLVDFTDDSSNIWEWKCVDPVPYSGVGQKRDCSAPKLD
ncbi:MAG: hypothetical protein GF332_00820, partial [Candidatus Moranbacteria bacterium]|nr:hypothetical protein [Candidatus Moranbacteria bacterium]